MAHLRKTLFEYLFVTLTVIMGLAVSFWLSVAERNTSDLKLREQFSIAAHDRINVITKAFQSNIAVNHAVVSFFASSTDVTREEFRHFTSQVMRDYPHIEAIEWAPRVPASERAAYEAKAQQAVPGYAFHDISPTGEMIAAQPRDPYYPIYFIEPVVDFTARIFGADFMTDPVRRQALEAAMATGRTVVTPKVTLLSSRLPGVLFVSPVQGGDALKGFVISAIPLGPMVAKAIEPLNKEGVNIIAHDVTDAADEAKPLFIHASRLKNAADEEVLAIYHSYTMREVATIEIGERKWRLTVLPSQGFFIANHDDANLILGMGAIVTFMLAYYMLRRVRENIRITDEVELRTHQLRQMQNEVELILHSTSEGIIGLDANGLISFSNEIASEILGYSYAEMKGLDFHDLVQHSKASGEANVRERSPMARVLAAGEEAKNIDHEIFWRKHNMPLQVEYTASAMKQDGRVNGVVIIFRDIAERKLNQEKLEQMAHSDQLTGLANRRLFLEMLHKALSRAARTRGKVGLIYVDLNNFKPVNDTLGHAAGDMLLKEFASRAARVVRDYDTIARMGGDEFAIVIDQFQSERDCEAFLGRLLNALKDKYDILGNEIQVTASIGIAIYPDHADTLDSLIAAADHAMYEAKKNKDKPFIFWRPELGPA